MRTMTDRRWAAIMLTALLATACSGEKRANPVAEAPLGPAPVATPVISPAPVLSPDAPIPPETLATVDSALAAAKAFNAKIPADLAAIAAAERKIRGQGAKALDAARRGDAAAFKATRGGAEASRKTLNEGLAALGPTVIEQQAAVTTALMLCSGTPLPDPATATGATPSAPLPSRPVATPPPAVVSVGAPGAPAPATTGLAAHAGCVALPAEAELMTRNIAALTARYQAAEVVYRQEQAGLEEAAAIVALGR